MAPESGFLNIVSGYHTKPDSKRWEPLFFSHSSLTFGHNVLDIDGRVAAGCVVPSRDAESQTGRSFLERDCQDGSDLPRVVGLNGGCHFGAGGDGAEEVGAPGGGRSLVQKGGGRRPGRRQGGLGIQVLLVVLHVGADEACVKKEHLVSKLQRNLYSQFLTNWANFRTKK